MQIEYYGGNCVKIATKKIAVIVDDNLSSLGQKLISKPDNILIYTNKTLSKDHPPSHFSVTKPGEYEVSDVSIQAVAARQHIDESEQKSGIIVRLVIDDIKIGILGHVHPDLSEHQLEALGMIDILIVPVGGNGYTLDGIGAIKLIKKIDPKIVIPTHYADKALKYEVPPAPLEEALKNMAMEVTETLDSLKLKGRDFGDGSTKMIVLNRQS